MNWQKFFEKRILARGYDYYCENAVADLKRKNNVVTANVYGTKEYEVVITFEDVEIMEMYCSCPYADEGYYCKHMAAVLYELDDKDIDDDEYEEIATNDAINSNINSETTSALVAEAEEELVRKFLTSVLEENEMLKMRFKNLVHSEVSKEDMNNYMRQIEKIVRTYQGRNHFVNYDEALDFISNLKEFLYKDVKNMLSNGNYEHAFELTNYIFLTVGDTDMDDSDGGTGMLAEHCYEIWEEILENCNSKVKKLLYDWFTSHLDGSVIDYMEDYMVQILMEDFQEKEFIEDKLLFTDRKVKEAEKSTDSWSKEYQAGQWALRHLSLMEKNKKNWCEIESYCKEHWDSSSVRKYYIGKCLDKKDYDSAIEVLKESQKLDKSYTGLVRDYSIKLKEIYQLTGKKKEYIQQLWKLILKDNPGSLDIYKELKAQYTIEEWEIQREKIFKGLPSHAHIDVLYKEDKLYDRLLDFVLKSPGLYALSTYKDVLKKDYSIKILEKYEIEVEKMAYHTSDRKHYQELVTILRKMSKLTGGKQIVNEIASRWRMNYGNRPAMMDELNKL